MFNWFKNNNDNYWRERFEQQHDHLVQQRQQNTAAWASSLMYQREVRRLNRALNRRNNTNKRNRQRIEEITRLATELRLAQRAYYADTGNSALAQTVAYCAARLDAVLPPYTDEDKAAAMAANARAIPAVVV